MSEPAVIDRHCHTAGIGAGESFTRSDNALTDLLRLRRPDSPENKTGRVLP